jgi:PadR family transcriptional regulator, regulatory protein AphA
VARAKTPALTTTSYAILGLLALRDWTTYEIAQQMRRGFRRLWPRAESKIYEEPKKLVGHGYAMARTERRGRRASTVYSITAAGRRALRAWVRDPQGAEPAFESEHLMKIFFGEFSTKQALLDEIDAVAAWAEAYGDENVRIATELHSTGGPFPDRLAQIVLLGRFHVAFADVMRDWASTARRTVERWPDDPSSAAPDLDFVASIAARGDR